MRLERSQISISEAAKKVKQAESDCMTTRKAAEEAYAALQEMHERTLKQAALMRDIDTHAHKIDEEETQLVAQFADYMLHVSTRFTQAEVRNSNTQRQYCKLSRNFLLAARKYGARAAETRAGRLRKQRHPQAQAAQRGHRAH